MVIYKILNLNILKYNLYKKYKCSTIKKNIRKVKNGHYKNEVNKRAGIRSIKRENN